MTTDPFALRVLAVGQLAHFISLGYDVIAIARPAPDLNLVAQRENVPTIAVPMEREIRPWADLISLVRIYRLLRRLQPTIVNAGTPKAGLLGMLAAWLAGVPVRVYTVRGLRLETTSGLKRKILVMAERIAAGCATRVVCISESLRQIYLQHGLTRAEKACVLGHGSSNGLHAERFAPSDNNKAAGKALRAKLGIPTEAIVIGFVGRLVRDKGIGDLIEAFDHVRQTIPEARLLLVGDFEQSDPVPDVYKQRIESDLRIFKTGFVDDVAPYYAAMNLLAFPSYREGFGNAAIEAAAAGLAVVGYSATGVVDAVEDGVTGTLVPVCDIRQLAEALARYLADPMLRAKHGEAGRLRVLAEFRPQDIWKALHDEYSRLLQERGLGACDGGKA